MRVGDSNCLLISLEEMLCHIDSHAKGKIEYNIEYGDLRITIHDGGFKYGSFVVYKYLEGLNVNSKHLLSITACTVGHVVYGGFKLKLELVGQIDSSVVVLDCNCSLNPSIRKFEFTMDPIVNAHQKLLLTIDFSRNEFIAREYSTAIAIRSIVLTRLL